MAFRNEVKAYLDVSFALDNSTAPNSRYGGRGLRHHDRHRRRPCRTWVLKGYPRPKDPFTVTWSPLTRDPVSPTWGRVGDATFNVFGSMSVPDNDVRVLWNWGANSMGPVGYPIFNSGKVTYDNCNPSHSDGCRPALVASALGSWTTGTWPAAPTPEQQPDALASTGAVRAPFRQVRIVACVGNEAKGTYDEPLAMGERPHDHRRP